MALRVNSITVQFKRLPLGISWTGLRFKSTATNKEKRQKELAASEFQVHHGEKIWIYSHILEGMTVYSHRPVLKANKALRQLTFNGKKLKPSKFRRDYWRTFAMIQFPEGFGDVGRSVFQRLRECKKLHELSWDNDMFYDKDGKPLTKHERGSKINDQKTNTVADMAAVLGGLGKGSRIWMTVSQDPKILANLEAGDEKNLKKDENGVVKALVKAQVWWFDDKDRNFAKSWPPNVTHYRFDQAAIEEMGTDTEAPPEQDSESGEAAKEGEDQEGVDQKSADQEEVGQKRADEKEADQKRAGKKKAGQKKADKKEADQNNSP
ncbi:transcriptional regulation of mitochondrial recombination-domain-containing protein [Daldinia vernicosa]|uniref:transcriptional regulation of mitochondrial recombination-domain-containing protein n=1 Tax=Daldinia vernicosa TaxID=114800 RepID=UPI002007AC8F|nr:transcriptional regulation of mitochondrial recombination-domain-containing protein [Daldinia vernicosa]KAI0847749.1 transcriptional regulation of mitochondrial recombination-domain-containing protein [Daldinia vernicosa]